MERLEKYLNTIEFNLLKILKSLSRDNPEVNNNSNELLQKAESFYC